MKITQQYSENECGVCVLNSFVGYFYNIDQKIEIFEQSQLTANGLSIFEFEQLGKQFGLLIESFELDYEYYLENFENQHCVTLFNNHYLIIRKKHNFIEIYDSNQTEIKKQSIDEFKKNFSNVIITVKKASHLKNNFTFTKKSINEINPKIFTFILLIDFFVFLLSILSAKYFSFLIEWCFSSSEIKNGLFISIAFLLFGVISSLFSYLKNTYGNKCIKSQTEEIFNFLVMKLRLKKPCFYKKFNVENFYSMETFVFGVTNYLVFEIPSTVSNFIFSIVSAIILISFNFYFSIPIFLVLLFSTVITIFENKTKKQFLSSGVSIHNKNAKNYNQICRFANYEDYLNLNNSFHQNNCLSQNAKNFNGLISFAFVSLEIFFSIIFSYVCCFFVFSSKTSIANFLFLTSLMTIFIHCSIYLSHFFIKKNEYLFFKDYLDKIINIGNNDFTGPIKLYKVKSLEFMNTKITNGSKVSVEMVNTFFQPIDDREIKINNKNIKEINVNSLRGLLYFVNVCSEPNFNLKNLDKMPNIFFEIIAKIKVNINDYFLLSSDQKVLLNLLSLLVLSDRLILISNFILRKKWVFSNESKIILNHLKKTNFICFC